MTGIDINTAELIDTLRYFYRENKQSRCASDLIIKIAASLLDISDSNAIALFRA